MRRTGLLALALMAPGLALAGEAQIIDAAMSWMDDGRAMVSVTVLNDGEGCDRAVDRWAVLAPDGVVLGEGALCQPLSGKPTHTRGLAVTVPEGVEQVVIKARERVDAGTSWPLTLTLPSR